VINRNDTAWLIFVGCLIAVLTIVAFLLVMAATA
jgi:hypothetical protein